MLATKRDYNLILDVLKRIDVVPRQVLLEVTIAEVSLNKDLQFGIRYALASGRPAIVTVPIDPHEMPPAKARMMAMDRSLGNPPLMQSLSLGALSTLWSMVKER